MFSICLVSTFVLFFTQHTHLFSDIATRSGLKKVHANFDAIYERLNRAYEKYPADEKLRGGIIGIYAKMCADSLLRNKLFSKGPSLMLRRAIGEEWHKNLAINLSLNKQAFLQS
jgi:hypothetical protein